VTYSGPSNGGAWSNPANWTTTGTSNVGAIPDLSNVANVIIPSGMTAVYDSAVTGPVTSTVANNGNLLFNLSSPGTISMPITGSGSVSIGNTGAVTLTGTNSYTGGTHIQGGATLVAGSDAAIGGAVITSMGSQVTPAVFGTSTGVVLPSLSIQGGSTRLISDITTTGSQTYSDLIIGPNSGQTITLTSGNNPIQFLGKIDGLTNKAQSLVANAGSGDITIGDSVSSNSRINNLTLTAQRIYILADVLTAVHQTYNGDVYIGDASYLNQTPQIGFLFANYRNYFEYSTTTTTSLIRYLNQNQIYIRTLISEDPNVTFNGAVNDLVANTHTLLVGVIAPDNSIGSNTASQLNFMGAVGNVSPLYSLNAQVLVNLSETNALSNYIGSIGIVDSVNTFTDQTYRANMMTARASTQPGTVTFSVFDPNAAINYLLPVQTASNSACQGATCGRMNLQNPNHLDALVINGDNNYGGNQNNALGAGYWRAPATENNALGYVPPVVQPTLPPEAQPSLPPVKPQITEQRNPPPFHQNMQNLLSGSLNMGPGEAGTVKVSMVSPDNLRAYGSLSDIPAPIAKTLNVIIQTRVNGELLNFATSAPTDGFAFAMPEVLTPRYTFVSQQLAADGLPNTLQLAAVRPDGKPLPSWLKFNPETKTFTADRIPEGTPDMQLKIQTIQNGRVIEEIIVTIDLPN
jgi:autotransporter-associated beta strand protein